MRTEPVVLGDGLFRDPHALFARLREQGPALEVIMPNGLKVWLVTRYEEGRALLADSRLSKNVTVAGELFERHQTGITKQRDYTHAVNTSMVNMDPPDHTRLRGLVTKAFTMRQVARLRPRIEQITDDVLDALADRAEFDVISEFATPLVSMVISELLGVPADVRAEFLAHSGVLTVNAGRDEAKRASDALIALVGEIIEARRADLTDDLISSLILAADGTDRLTHDEITSFVILLFIGGFHTTVNLLGNGTLALLRNPDQLALLRADPSLLPNAVEEFMRYDGPAHLSHWRLTTAEIRIGDLTVPAGEFVFVALASANRDPARFEDPGRLDVTRDAHGQLGLGHGIHFCIGAPLARLEGEIAFGRLLARFPSLTPAVGLDQLALRPSMLHNGLVALPVRTGATT